MSQPLAIILAITAAYLLGSIPSAYLVGRLRKGVDIRTVGSRNMGAMNSFYNIGFFYGVIVLVMDIGKGYAAVAVGQWLGQQANLSWWMYLAMACGFIAVLGHNLPVWLKFKGGKGGATAIGAALFFIPWGWVVGLTIFAILLIITRVPTISYGLAMTSFPLVSWLIYHNGRFVIYTALIVLVPLFSYIPRLLEMRRKGGSWRHVFRRKSIKDRF
ncbi:MAG: glycerol-3-phosphate acyltransferase [Dehalococcoidia bacterium]|nr:glycerol-3-phosphate acyltransferase [Dehalococcoidia bacterium]